MQQPDPSKAGQEEQSDIHHADEQREPDSNKVDEQEKLYRGMLEKQVRDAGQDPANPMWAAQIEQRFKQHFANREKRNALLTAAYKRRHGKDDTEFKRNESSLNSAQYRAATAVDTLAKKYLELAAFEPEAAMRAFNQDCRDVVTKLRAEVESSMLPDFDWGLSNDTGYRALDPVPGPESELSIKGRYPSLKNRIAFHNRKLKRAASRKRRKEAQLHSNQHSNLTNAEGSHELPADAQATEDATPPDGAGETVERTGVPETTATTTQARINRFLAEARKYGNVNRTDIWREAGYKDPRGFEHFQKDDPKCTATARQAFEDVLNIPAEEFVKRATERRDKKEAKT